MKDCIICQAKAENYLYVKTGPSETEFTRAYACGQHLAAAAQGLREEYRDRGGRIFTGRLMSRSIQA